MKIPPRRPSYSVKYAASGLISARICWILSPAVPLRTAVLNGSWGSLTCISIRIVDSLGVGKLSGLESLQDIALRVSHRCGVATDARSRRTHLRSKSAFLQPGRQYA